MFGATDQNMRDLLATLPEELPVLPLRNMVAFPFTMLPIGVGVPRSIKLVQDAMHDNRLVVLVTSHDPEIDEPTPDQVHQVGSIAYIQRAAQGEDNSVQLVVHVLERVKIKEWTSNAPYLKARIEVSPDTEEASAEAEALRRSLTSIAREVVALMPNVPNEVGDFLEQVESNRLLVYMIAANARMELNVRQEILEQDSVNAKMRRLIQVLAQEKEVLALGQKITSETQEKIGKEQREFFLRRQLDAIRKELGEVDDEAAEIEGYREKIDKANLPTEAREQADRELKRMERLSSQSAEYGVIRSYLDWLVELPWSKASEDNLDIEHARQVLNEDHYDLKEVKDRILEFLAVRKLAKDRAAGEIAADGQPAEETREAMGTILLFVGPPGVGKTSLGKSIARALGREFTRMSLGGMRDEAEIRGHRRTYIGAMPGRVIQALKRAGTRNPVFMLDEVDKIGADWRGDPASALLEVLDPQQNNTFRDHYLDVDFDLSDVIFIATANQLDTIPGPLLDRMEMIQLDGYTEYEKIKIAQEHLIGRQLRANSLQPDEVIFDEAALRKIIREYTREAGVRNLEREIGAVMRKAAVHIAARDTEGVNVTPELVREYLGKPRFQFEAGLRTEIPGVATGMAWTPVGGDVLFVEASRSRGHGNLTITGQLGKVMEESVRIAYSYLRAHAEELDIDEERFENSDFHIHVPEGAVPKDGPSAGITMTTAIYSLVTGRPVRSDVAMTGEITLRGAVSPVGGIKMKVLAAHRAGLQTIILPKRNVDDLDELPDDVRHDLTFVPVEHIDEVLAVALRDQKPESADGTAPRKKRTRRAER
ncbi:MAG: endopeptidase La, partial [Anaerolineae bacterium]|nr:endopeptidase La [Anaerolineae bacterium]